MGTTIEDGQKVDVWMLGKSFERIFRVLEESYFVYFKNNSGKINNILESMLCRKEKRLNLIHIEI